MRARIERGFAAWGHWAYRHRWWVIAAVVAVTAAFGTQLPRLTIDTSTEGFLHENDPIRVTYEAFRRRFGRDELILLAIEPPKIFDLEFLEKLRRLHEDIEREVPRLEEVTSLINARETRGEGDALIVGELLEEWPETPEDLAGLERRVRANPLYENLLVSADGGLTTITIKTDAYSAVGDDADALAGFGDVEAGGPAERRPFITGPENHVIVQAVKRIVDRYQAPDFKIYMTGSPTLTDHLTEAMQRDTAVFTLLSIAAISIFLTILFRRPAAVVLALVVVGCSVVCTFAIMAMAETPLTLPTEILPSFLLAVGVGNAVHILAIFFQRRREGDDEEAAIAAAFGHSALAVLMACLTTAGGLFSFIAADMAPIADLGVFGPVGVMMALAFTIILLPALIAVVPLRGGTGPTARGPQLSQRLLIRTGVFATRHAGAVLIVVAVVLVVSLAGALQIRFSHDPIRWFPDDDYFRVSSEVLNQRLNGVMPLEIVVATGKQNGLHDPDLLRRLQAVGRYAETLSVDGITAGKTVSLVDIIKEIHQALNENQAAYYTLPADRRLVAQELLLFENSGTDDLEDFVDTQFSTGRITARLVWVDGIRYPAFLSRLEEGMRGILDGRAEYTVTGLIAVVGKTIGATVYSMATSYVIAFLVITPLMIILVGELGVGLLSMLPTLTPIVMTLGAMGWLDIPLDAFTLLVGSIAIGLAVDNTIHFMHNFRRYIAVSGDVSDAVAATLGSTGQAMLYTAMVLSTGFYLYLFSSMDNLFYFGLLTGTTIMMALIACVVMAPALMVFVHARRRVPVASAQPTEVC